MRGKGHRGFGLAPSAREWLRIPEWQREEERKEAWIEKAVNNDRRHWLRA